MSGIKLVIAGANGRMGQALQRALTDAPDFQLVAALRRGDDPLPAVAQAEVLVDFSAPACSVELAGLAAQAHVAHVIGTTGFSRQQESAIAKAAEQTAIVKSGNMSLGVTLLAALVQQAAKALPDFDIEIVEMHHRMKVDAPSGTALLLGEAAASGRDISVAENAIRGRDGHTGARKDGAIGFASLRGGTVVGEHRVILAGPHERIELAHIAEDRMIFARGALAAARWAIGQPPGLYSIADVLGISA
jgi:4-hydroxy-tetrahydrodipicolinate reductase